MLSLSGSAKIFLCHLPTNLRKSFEGLSRIVVEHFEKELISHSYFVFLNQRRNLVKVLYFDGDGLAIWSKRLEKGHFPKVKSNEPIIDRRDLMMLLEGVVATRKAKRFKVS